MAFLSDKDFLDRANRGMLITMVGGGLVACALGASISGRVTGHDGEPVQYAEVDLCLWNAAEGWCDEWLYAETDSNGEYREGGLRAGDYKVAFYPYDGEHVTEWWDDELTMEDADLITLGAVEARTGVDAELATGGVVAGWRGSGLSVGTVRWRSPPSSAMAFLACSASIALPCQPSLLATSEDPCPFTVRATRHVGRPFCASASA